MEEVGRRPPGSRLRMVKKPRRTLPRVSPVSCKHSPQPLVGGVPRERLGLVPPRRTTGEMGAWEASLTP